MNTTATRRILLFVLLILVQVLILNHIHLFGYATPLPYVAFVLLTRRNFPRWATLLVSFALGAVIDLFSNTPGVAMGSLTLIGLIQPPLLEVFVPRDSAEDLEPSMKTLGVNKFIFFTVLVVFIFCLCFFTLETFNFFNWIKWLECVGGSTVFTSVLILVLENMRKR